MVLDVIGGPSSSALIASISRFAALMSHHRRPECSRGPRRVPSPTAPLTHPQASLDPPSPPPSLLQPSQAPPSSSIPPSLSQCSHGPRRLPRSPSIQGHLSRPPAPLIPCQDLSVPLIVITDRYYTQGRTYRDTLTQGGLGSRDGPCPRPRPLPPSGAHDFDPKLKARQLSKRSSSTSLNSVNARRCAAQA